MISSKPSRFLRPFAASTWVDQHVDGVDVGGRADLGDHDQVEPVAGLLQHVDHVAVHVLGVEAVDAHREGLGAPVDLVDRLDDVLARLLLLVRGHRVLEVEEDHVGRRLRAAFSNICGLEPGTASSERLSRGVACSTIVKLMRCLPCRLEGRCRAPADGCCAHHRASRSAWTWV